ncbi:MAG TPA: TIGR00341 family protein [Anaerolineae bacterium]|nr:TIGR00341 family protein [Caldilineae bacterium]HID33152.1 TIGR00341 family protein [Anaerolineae bacterium]HIQ12222.1 TIGR00341 family protein [Caldilineales bacterium]
MKTILVPLSRPEQAAILSTFILPVARGERARVILLHIRRPLFNAAQEEASVDGREEEDDDWLAEAAQRFQNVQVDVEVARREAQSVAGGIRDAVAEFKPDLLALSWRRPGPNERVDEDVTLHDLLMDVPCDLVVWRGNQAAPPPHRVLIPSAGGPNIILGFRFAQDFHQAYGSRIIVMQVAPQHASEEEVRAIQLALEERTRQALAGLALPPEAIDCQVVRADSPEEGILQMATPIHADVVLIGASREGVLHRIRFGEIPEKVAARAQIPVLVIKRPLPRRMTLFRRLWDGIAAITPNLTETEKVEVYRESRRSARTTRDFITMIALSTIIATLGLILNAPAVIIGAMLIAPLMGAIIAMGLGVVQGDARLLRLGIRTTFWGVLTTLGVSFIMESLIPYNDLTPEMIARSEPNLLDLGVALAAGAAGAYALTRKHVSSSLPGVAIAVALIPPLSTTGMALALRSWETALGAGLLFLTNLVGIVAMSSWIFLSMGFQPQYTRRERIRLFSQGWRAILVMILLISIPLAVVTVQQLKQQHIETAMASALREEVVALPHVVLRDWSYQAVDEGYALELEVEAEEPLSHADVAALQEHLADRLGMPVEITLKIIPVIRLQPAYPEGEITGG